MSGSGWKWWFHGCWMWKTRPNIWRLGSHGRTPSYHPCFFWIVFKIHHPAIGVPPWLWKRTDSGAGRDHRLGRCHGGARTASAAEVLYSIGSEWGWGMEGLSLFLKGEYTMVWNRTIWMKSKIHAVYKSISALTSCVWRYIIYDTYGFIAVEMYSYVKLLAGVYTFAITIWFWLTVCHGKIHHF